MKYLITGLGNIGDEYLNTRHNVGFSILDVWANASNIAFTDRRYGFVAKVKDRGRTYILLKPSTYVNRSGNAVNYWLKKEKIDQVNLLVVTDDISLPLGSIRLRQKGGDGGHNGLAHINSVLGSGNYARLRFGIGDNFTRGHQVDHVLGRWTNEELKLLAARTSLAIEMIKSFGFVGPELTMTRFNKHGRITDNEDE